MNDKQKKAFAMMDAAIDSLVSGGNTEEILKQWNDGMAMLDEVHSEQMAEFDAQQKQFDKQMAEAEAQYQRNMKAIDDWKNAELAKLDRKEQRLKRKYGSLWPNF